MPPNSLEPRRDAEQPPASSSQEAPLPARQNFQDTSPEESSLSPLFFLSTGGRFISALDAYPPVTGSRPIEKQCPPFSESPLCFDHFMQQVKRWYITEQGWSAYYEAKARAMNSFTFDEALRKSLDLLAGPPLDGLDEFWYRRALQEALVQGNPPSLGGASHLLQTARETSCLNLSWGAFSENLCAKISEEAAALLQRPGQPSPTRRPHDSDSSDSDRPLAANRARRRRGLGSTNNGAAEPALPSSSRRPPTPDSDGPGHDPRHGAARPSVRTPTCALCPPAEAGGGSSSSGREKEPAAAPSAPAPSRGGPRRTPPRWSVFGGLAFEVDARGEGQVVFVVRHMAALRDQIGLSQRLVAPECGHVPRLATPGQLI